jgi:hypothetical protein
MPSSTFGWMRHAREGKPVGVNGARRTLRRAQKVRCVPAAPPHEDRDGPDRIAVVVLARFHLHPSKAWPTSKGILDGVENASCVGR